MVMIMVQAVMVLSGVDVVVLSGDGGDVGW